MNALDSVVASLTLIGVGVLIFCKPAARTSFVVWYCGHA